MKVSYIELYCEELRDLLDLDTAAKDMHIREDDQVCCKDVFYANVYVYLLLLDFVFSYFSLVKPSLVPQLNCFPIG